MSDAARAAVIAPLRGARAGTPPRPFETLLGRRRPGGRGWRAGAIVAEGWRASGVDVGLEPPIDWSDRRLARSALFALNAWIPLTPLLTRRDDGHDRDGRLLAFTRAVALDWLRQHDEHSEAPMAWYDMAIGHRAHRLGWIIDQSLRDPACGDDVLLELLAGAELHAAVLARADVMTWHSNHGLFMAVGQLALARRLADVPQIGATAPQAASRLRRMLEDQFAADGVHIEHSPGYHLAAVRTLQGVSESGLVDADEFADLRRRAERALAWMTQPSGEIVPIGDSPAENVRGRGAEVEYLDEVAAWVVSDGQAGRAAAERVRAFTAGGLACARTWVPGGDASHLALTAAFHSRVHKQADDGAFSWSERGGPLIIDGGRYGYRGRTEPGSALARQGYWYDDPSRVYVESTHAHATIELDGRSWPRVDVTPYGSGIQAAADRQGCLTLHAEIPHPGVHHRRVLVLHPGCWLLVLDAVEAHAGAEVVQRFLFAPDLEPDGELSVTRAGWSDRLWLRSLVGARTGPVLRGVTSPRHEGWFSPAEGELSPASSVAYSLSGASTRFATLLTFGQSRPVPGIVTFDDERWRASWSQDGRRHTVAVPARGPVRPDYWSTGSTAAAS